MQVCISLSDYISSEINILQMKVCGIFFCPDAVEPDVAGGVAIKIQAGSRNRLTFNTL